MKRRRKWRPPNNPTRPAQQVWRALYPGDPWPTGWTVGWAGWMRGASGLCLRGQRKILLSHGDAKQARAGWCAVDTLVHEFVHVRCRTLKHGREFDRIEASMLARLGLPPTAIEVRAAARKAAREIAAAEKIRTENMRMVRERADAFIERARRKAV
jgi:hypothetical protein